jgi:hypothetical protein
MSRIISGNDGTGTFPADLTFNNGTGTTQEGGGGAFKYSVPTVSAV